MIRSLLLVLLVALPALADKVPSADPDGRPLPSTIGGDLPLGIDRRVPVGIGTIEGAS
jgi:hypothetical protein